MQQFSLRKIHDFLMAFVMLATVLLMICQPFGLFGIKTGDLSFLLVALWVEILYLAAVIFVRVVRSDREDYRRLDAAFRRIGSRMDF